jgi:hypothetical protein
MSSLWNLVEPTVGDGVVDPIVAKLLQAIVAPAGVTALTATAQSVGEAKARDLVAIFGSLLPIPVDGVMPANPLDALPTTARLIDPQGWEATLQVPTIDLPLPELSAGRIETGSDGRAHVVGDSSLGPVTLHIGAAAGGSALLTIRAPNGTDPSIELGGVEVTVTPEAISLPAGFGARVGTLHLDAAGVRLPGLAFFLPPLPRLPVGEIPLALTFGRLAGFLAGVAGSVTRDVPFPGAATPAALMFAIDRPTARTLLDLIPTRVEFNLPLDGGSFQIDASHPLDPLGQQGGSLAIRGALGVTDAGATLHAELAGNGNERGLASVAGTDLALAAAIAPHLLPPDVRDAAATTILAALAAVPLTGADGGGEVVIHGLAIDAAWGLDEAAPAGLRVRLDYESRIGVSLSAGPMSVATKSGSPIQVRYSNVGVTPAIPPVLSWQDAPMNLVSLGDWEVSGIPDDLLRVNDVRSGRGSLLIDIDLQVAVDLGVVTVDQTTVRLSIGGGLPVAPAGFGVAVKIPGVLDGHGQISFPPDGGFGAALDVSLPTLGASGRAVVAIGEPLVVVAFEARLFAPIPFANSGLGLFGMSGALASGAERRLPNTPTDPILREVAWTPFNPNAWGNGNQVFVGIGAEIGTVPDLGFAFSSKAGILIGVPDALFRVSLEAKLMRGVTGTMTGVLVIDKKAVTAGLVGKYTIPVLLDAEVPAGARFPFDKPSQWEARLGGDGDDKRSGPVKIRILPDLLDLEAWAFLMAFGDAATTVGATLAPPGFALDGLSLAFGAGVDVHWEAGPFSFDAHGVLLAVLTHKPPPPGSDARPWMLAGLAEIRGSVDLGPVSIGASARLDVIVSDSPIVLYGHAKACASVDLWLFEVEGCVEFDIGDRPLPDVPVPESPLLGVQLTDRRALVIEPAIEGGTATAVWADTIPVLTFSHWVSEATPVAGIRQPIGNALAANDGWVGTAELEYRFELRSARVFERPAGGAEQEVGGAWDASWQLPLSTNVWGGGDTPPEARALALGILDPHHRLQPATFLGPAAGDPIGILGRLCEPNAPPAATWFAGGDAVFEGLAGPISVPPRPAPRRTQDPGAMVVELVDELGNSIPLDENADAVAAQAGLELEPSWLEPATKQLALDDQSLDGRLWLPRMAMGDNIAPTVLRLTARVTDAELYLVTDAPEGEAASVSWFFADEDWAFEGDVDTWDGRRVQKWKSTGGGSDEIWVRQRFGFTCGLVALRATGEAALAQWAANEDGRRVTQESLADAAADAGTPRRMLRPGADYRVEVEVAWAGRGKNRTPGGGTFAPRSFGFTVASKGVRPAPPGQPGKPAKLADVPMSQIVEFKSLASASRAAMHRYDETVLDRADLGRYVGGFEPVDGTVDHFLGDPVQVLFSVDHLPDLAAVYEERLSIVAIRTEGPPDEGGAEPGTILGLIAAIILGRPAPTEILPRPVTTSHLTTLDAARSAFVDGSPADPSCRIRRPGMAVEPLGRLVPRSTYRLGVHIDAAPQGLPPEPAGSHAAVASSMFRTSRYGGPRDLLAALAFTAGGGVPLAGIPLPDSALATLPGLAAAGDGSDRFEEALGGIGLAGYAAPAEPRASMLWVRGADSAWQAAGLLLECPESINRPGRATIGTIRLGGTELAGRYWDGRRTRLVALAEPFALPAGATAEVELQETPVGSAAEPVATLRAAVAAFAPLNGVLA